VDPARDHPKFLAKISVLDRRDLLGHSKFYLRILIEGDPRFCGGCSRPATTPKGGEGRKTAPLFGRADYREGLDVEGFDCRVPGLDLRKVMEVYLDEFNRQTNKPMKLVLHAL